MTRLTEVAVVIGMCDGYPLVEVFSDVEGAVKYGEAKYKQCNAKLRVELRYVDRVFDEEGEA